MTDRSWDMGDAEPGDVRVLTDDTDSDGDDSSDVWSLTTHDEPGMRWKGYKDGGKVYVSWDELTRRWGPLREAQG